MVFACLIEVMRCREGRYLDGQLPFWGPLHKVVEWWKLPQYI
jgi:hypothetical protein